MKFKIILFFYFFKICSLWAWPPTYGAEFTFTSDLLDLDETAGTKVRNEWAKKMKAICKERGDCTVKNAVNKSEVRTFIIEYSDGWWFQVSVDPGCIEVQTKPSTIEELKTLKNRIKKDIFSMAKSFEIFPHDVIGGGHLNIGATSAFENNPKLFRDFVVDFMNHPEIAEGALDVGDIINAPTLADNGEAALKNFDKVISDFDQGKIKSMEKLAVAIQDRVYEKVDVPNEENPSKIKYQALNMTTIADSDVTDEFKRLEIRSVKAQKSIDEFILQCQLFEKRMQYLKTLRSAGSPIKFSFPESIIGPKTGVPLFYRYVSESGLKWKDYKPMMDDHWRSFKFVPCDSHFESAP